MFHHSSEVILQHDSDQLLECIATTCSRCTIDQCIQEQTGQTLDEYGRMKVPVNKPSTSRTSTGTTYKYK